MTATTRPASTAAEVVLVGTSGGPPPRTGRRGICTAVNVGGRSYVVDLGRSAVDQLYAAGVAPNDVEAVLVTHMHSDHIADLYNFFFLNWGWPDSGVDGLTRQVAVHGPAATPVPAGMDRNRLVCPDDPYPGLAGYFEHMVAGTAADVNIRVVDEGKTTIEDLYAVHEIAPGHDGPLVVHEDDRVRITAVRVVHPPIELSYAYRIDSDAGSVVVSGDTAICDAVGNLAAGADILCHEAIDIDSLARRGVQSSLLSHLVDSHSDSREVGALAEAAGVPTLVLHHLVPGDERMVPDDVWDRHGRKGYTGRLVVGRDLTRIPIGKEQP